MADQNDLTITIKMVNEAKDTLKELTKNFQDLGTTLKGTSNQVKEMTNAQKLYSESMTKLLGDTKAAEVATKALADAHKSVVGTFQEMAESGGRVGGMLAELGPLGLAAGAAFGLVAERAREGLSAYIAFVIARDTFGIGGFVCRTE